MANFFFLIIKFSFFELLKYFIDLQSLKKKKNLSNELKEKNVII
jgi:hypothetical protein